MHELPPGPLIVIANEFFDALPIRQFQRVDPLWRERQVALAAGRLTLGWGPPRPTGDSAHTESETQARLASS